jgi:acetyltransferase-like isoleucine patch superfamily enzyme
MAWTLATLVLVQSIVCLAAALPPLALWRWLHDGMGAWPALQLVADAGAIVPLYVLFALLLMVASPLAVRILGWRTPADIEMRVADMGWPLLGWVRAGASAHLVRVFSGALFRGTPIWTAYLRWSGAKLGRRVYVNSLFISDYNLLSFGDDVVIGGGVHLSGHTVEHGVVKTGRVIIGDRVTVGVESVLEIGVRIDSDVQVGALSFVPKHARLTAGRTYVGVPAAPLASGRRAD